jgi:hypothetical protein
MSIMPESGRLRIPISYIYYARIKCNAHGRLRIRISYIYYARIKCNMHGRLRVPISYVYYARIKCNMHGRLRIPILVTSHILQKCKLISKTRYTLIHAMPNYHAWAIGLHQHDRSSYKTLETHSPRETHTLISIIQTAKTSRRIELSINHQWWDP